MSDAPGYANLVPGFDFLQGLVKNAGAAIPGIGQWVAPTLDPDELGRRIEELRTVKFWLEQNAQILESTIQALEVQRMTLSTLKSMNLQMDDLRESLQVRVPAAGATTAADPTPDAPARRRAPRKKVKSEGAGTAASATPAAGPIDPMQWWSALTKQFTEIAASAARQTQAEATAPSGQSAPGYVQTAAPGGAATVGPQPRAVKIKNDAGKRTRAKPRRRKTPSSRKSADA